MLEEHDHFTRRQKKLDAMELNNKLLIEELMKQICDEIKDGFTKHESVVDKCLTEIVSSAHSSTRNATLLWSPPQLSSTDPSPSGSWSPPSPPSSSSWPS
jgi:hypothetical protein